MNTFTPAMVNYQQQLQYSNNTSHCGYPSKRCENPRVVKRNGELHRFCDQHRLAANRNQQRLQQRRRFQKNLVHHDQDLAVMQQLYSEYAAQQEGTYCPQSTDTLLDLSEEDLRVLEVMLLDDEDFAMDDWHFDLLQSRTRGCEVYTGVQHI